MAKTITNEDLALFEAEESKPGVKIARRAVESAGLVGSATDAAKKREVPFVFNLVVEAGDVCNQKRSGRCWMFAGLNVLRVLLAEKLNVKSVELSQAYLQFYDKLEKANFFLEKGLERFDKPLNDPEMVYLFDKGIADGGHFAMFKNLVKKYGVIPHDAMVDGAVASDTGELNKLLSTLLAQDLLELREAKAAGKDVENRKKEMLAEIYRVLGIALGFPPKEFRYDYEDKDGVAHRIESTPKAFYETYIGQDLEEYICLAHVPMIDLDPYTKVYAPLVSNVIEGEEAFFFPVEEQELQDAVKEELKKKRPVWFSADVGAESLRKEGYLVRGIHRLDELTGTEIRLSKGEKLDTRVSACTHAMTFTGAYVEEDGTISRYKVENSWGDENGKKGYYVMDKAWFEEYVHQVFVRKDSLPKALLEKYEAAPKKAVPPFNTLWDMGN